MIPRFQSHETRDSLFTTSRQGARRLARFFLFRVGVPCLLLIGVLATTLWLALVPIAHVTHAASQKQVRVTLSATLGTALVMGPGFDACNAPSTSALAAWWGTSPYRWFGTYLGGEAAGSCSGANLTASWVGSVIGQGWGLLPI